VARADQVVGGAIKSSWSAHLGKPNQDTPSDEVLKGLTGLQERVRDLMAEKESLMLNFAYNKVPRPYYIRWKEEANAIFAQSVTLEVRRRAIAAKLRSKSK
jgi:hypothetical protein